MKTLKERGWKFIFHHDHIIIAAGAFLLLWVLSVITFNVSFLNPVAKALDSFSVTDIFFDINHSGAAPQKSDVITIVDMTDLMDRSDIALALERVALCNPSCIGVDLIFEGRRADEEDNRAVVEAAAYARDKAVFATKLTDYSSEEGTFRNSVHSFFADEVAPEEGYVNLVNNLDGMPVRQLSTVRTLNGRRMESFAARLASKYAGRHVDLGDEDLLINYRNIEFPVVPCDSIEVCADLLEGRIVLFGTMREERDMHTSPLGKTPGVVIQAHSVDSLLGGDVKELPKWIVWVIGGLLCWLFQVSTEAVYIATSNRPASPMSMFLKDSEAQFVVAYFLWSLVFCYILYMLFIRWQLCVEGAVVLALLALCVESRNLYMGIIFSMNSKYADRKFVKDSIFNDY